MPPVTIFSSKPINTSVLEQPFDYDMPSASLYSAASFPFKNPFQPDPGFARRRPINGSSFSSNASSNMSSDEERTSSVQSSDEVTTPRSMTGPKTPPQRTAESSVRKSSFAGTRPRTVSRPSISFALPEEHEDQQEEQQCVAADRCGSPKSKPCAIHSDVHINHPVLQAHRRLMSVEKEQSNFTPINPFQYKSYSESDVDAFQFLEDELDFLEDSDDENYIEEDMRRQTDYRP